MAKKRIGLGVAVAAAVGLVASTAFAATYWTGWVSEESGGPVAGCSAWTEAAVGFGCSGSYCDNVRLLCETLPFGAKVNQATDYWSGWFSEEHDGYGTYHSEGWYRYEDENYHVCHSYDNQPGVVTGIRCSGSYCDNISVECSQLIVQRGGILGPTLPVGVTNCAWTGWYSEEQGSVDFGDNRYITGVECAGSRCDDKRFYVCSLVDPSLVVNP